MKKGIWLTARHSLFHFRSRSMPFLPLANIPFPTALCNLRLFLMQLFDIL